MSIFSKEQSFVSSLQVLHFAQVMGTVMFCLVMYVVSRDLSFTFNWDNLEPLHYVAFSASVLLPIFGIMLFKKQMSTASGYELLKDKLNSYRTYFIIRMGLVNGPALLCIVLLMSSKNGNLIYCIVALVVLQIFLRPTRAKIIEELSLDYEQQEELDTLMVPARNRGFF